MKARLLLVSLTFPFLFSPAWAIEPTHQANNKINDASKLQAAIKNVPTKAVMFNVMPATQQARAWLSILDKKNYGYAWEKASELVQKSISKEAFIEQAKRSREPLGSFIKRTIIMAQPHTQLPGSPKGHYVLITFNCKFNNKEKVTETIMVQQEPDTAWRVAGYFIL